MTTKPKIYLAGAIRDGNNEDLRWRNQFKIVLQPFATILDPTEGKSYNPLDKMWYKKVDGLDHHLVKHEELVDQDCQHIDACDIFVGNLLAMNDLHPCIGTLMELGRATKGTAGKYLPRIYLIYDPRATHTNTMFPIHPFIKRFAARTFVNPIDCLNHIFNGIQYQKEGATWQE